jgi:hypothetical protein
VQISLSDVSFIFPAMSSRFNPTSAPASK